MNVFSQLTLSAPPPFSTPLTDIKVESDIIEYALSLSLTHCLAQTHTYLHNAPGWAWQMAGKPKA